MTQRIRIDDGDAKPLQIIFSPSANDSYQSIENANELDEVDTMIELLGYFPGIGHIYDPVYEAVVPGFVMRVVHAGHRSIYYRIVERAETVRILFIEHQRADPKTRFKGESGEGA